MRPVGTWATLLLGVSMCAAIAGCSSGGPGGEDRAATPSASVPAWATAMLNRYDEAFEHASPGRPLRQVGPWTRNEGNWEPSMVAARADDALAAGLVESPVDLARAPAGYRPIEWDDATSRQAPLISAAQAAQELLVEARVRDTGDQCSGCTPLVVTGATLTTMTIGTTHGLATVPAWRLQLHESKVTLLRPAVDPQPVVTLTPFVNDARQPPHVETGRLAGDGVTLTVVFTGAPKPKTEPCGADYSGQAVESDHAVLVVVTEHPHETGGTGTCDAMGARRTVDVTLSRPLGDRVLLRTPYGEPAPLVRTQ